MKRQTTKFKKRSAETALPKAPPAELMRMLIPAGQALDLVTAGTAGDALANAMHQIGKMKHDGLGHLACTDILDALAELVLRAKQLSPDAVSSIQTSRDAIETAKRALATAERDHVRAKAEVLVALGYKEQADVEARS